ncbi:bifunctional 3-phenylpropionate/cinnamic acid dioxygenase ferredoxin subunit [Streptomyces sp. NPDC090106]|uniref:bifunctional 3-phenylpropionate/cinnamic acid dioxygenase ferredoxin subunit n=1 Tax=Streptomyces sp. NPDC090106 TaxID=3365946 RepID=UPI00381EFA7A
MGLTKVCEVGDVPEDEGFKADTLPVIAVFRVEGEFYAIDDTCSHGQSSLAEGYVEGCEVECAWHMARFDVRTGKAMCLPATTDLRTYPVTVVDGGIYVDLPDE